MPRESLVGKPFAGYMIESLIGEGGTSTVYRATHPTHGVVAVKVLREKLRNDRTAVARIQREAEYGTRVLHPNVVRTIEVGEAELGMHFLAIEWAAGELLERYAKRMGPLPREEVADIISQIASAVHAVHQAGLVHRDLKPDNVMYDPGTRQVKLLDFGIATDADINPNERLTRSGHFVGTLLYVAPESLSGEIVTPAADQYSLATIAYHLLTGSLPYTARSPREMFSQLLSDPPTPLNRARKELDFGPAVEGVIMHALSRDPMKRYPDVPTFALQLRQALLENPTVPQAEPEPVPDAGGMFGRLKRAFRKPS